MMDTRDTQQHQHHTERRLKMTDEPKFSNRLMRANPYYEGACFWCNETEGKPHADNCDWAAELETTHTRPDGWEPVDFEDLKIGDTIRVDCWDPEALVSVWTVENIVGVTRRIRICNRLGWYWVGFDAGFYDWVRKSRE